MSHIPDSAFFYNCEDTNNISKKINDPDNQLMDTNSFEFNTGTSTSDDSGLPLTSSFESSIDSYRISIGKLELFESDGEVSLLDSLENSPESGMSIENFNTLKKGPVVPIDPPPEFQDSPQATLIRSNILENYASQLSSNVISNAIPGCTPQNLILVNNKDVTECEQQCCNMYATDCVHFDNIYDEPHCNKKILNFNNEILTTKIIGSLHRNERDFKNFHDRQFSTLRKFNPSALSEIHDYDMYYGLKKNYNVDHYQHRKALYSPLHHNGGNASTSNRPLSRNSLSSRLSSSHNSLTVSNSNKPDDSIFITQAMSHDALLSREISDFYNVPVDSDIYASPIDMITPNNKYYSQRDVIKNKHKRLKYLHFNKRKKKEFFLDDCNEIDKIQTKSKQNRSENKRKSVPENSIEPLHLTLEEVKEFYQTLYSNTNSRNTYKKTFSMQNNEILKNTTKSNRTTRSVQYIKNATIIQSSKVKSISSKNNMILSEKQEDENNSNKININSTKKSQFSMNLKQKFCNIFRFGRNQRFKNFTESSEFVTNKSTDQVNVNENKEKIQFRALPPLPTKVGTNSTDDQNIEKEKKKTELNSSLHFASSIEKVKDYGWYWGPVSSEAAEKVLSNEPDGSFIVRDSSDDHYIFSLSFKLNNCVRHVRIEQDQGTFSFGSYAKFKSQTITEFIEKAVEHSRSGRYLFFLHRRPEHGPMRVQLTNPVSRFKHVQSLQHMCRFVILKMVIRKDLVQSLPLPRRLLDYLSYKHCYSEQIESDSSQSQISGDE